MKGKLPKGMTQTDATEWRFEGDEYFADIRRMLQRPTFFESLPGGMKPGPAWIVVRGLPGNRTLESVHETEGEARAVMAERFDADRVARCSVRVRIAEAVADGELPEGARVVRAS